MSIRAYIDYFIQTLLLETVLQKATKKLNQ
jgi:hypothetical protein